MTDLKCSVWQLDNSQALHSKWRLQGILATLTHAVLHHHKSTFVAIKALTLKAARSVDTRTTSTQVWGDPALINVCFIAVER